MMDLTSYFNSLSVKNAESNINNFAAVIESNHTEFVFIHFSNYINVIITQFEKIGNLYDIKVDQPDKGLSIPEPIYTVTTLLGGDNLEAEVAARYLTEKLKIRKPLLLCLSLKNYNKKTLNLIIEAVQVYRKQ